MKYRVPMPAVWPDEGGEAEEAVAEEAEEEEGEAREEVLSMSAAMPKSATLACAAPSRSTLEGLMSRCMTLLRWRKAMPAAFLMNMSLDPAKPFSRFEMINKDVSVAREHSTSPKIIDQTVSYKV